MSNEVAKWEERLAVLASEYTAAEQVGGSFLSTKGGVLRFGDDEMPGNQMVVIVLDVVHARTFYTEKFVAGGENNPPPRCYAFGRTPQEVEEMAPHPSMQADLSYFQPQNETCKGCPNNEWGTSDTGRGKACGERRRIALLPAGYYQPKRGSRDFDLHLFDRPEHVKHYESADIAYLQLPVMSVKDWSRYAIHLEGTHRRPPFGVISRVWLEPDPKSQFRVKFEVLELLPEELVETIYARHVEAKREIIFGYPPPSAEALAGRGGRSARR
jgi:hypothetical protein